MSTNSGQSAGKKSVNSSSSSPSVPPAVPPSSPPHSSQPLNLTIFHTSFASYLFEKSVHRAQAKANENEPNDENESDSDSAPECLSLSTSFPPLAVRYLQLNKSKLKSPPISSDNTKEYSLNLDIFIGKVSIVSVKSGKIAYYRVLTREKNKQNWRWNYKRFNEFIALDGLLSSVSPAAWLRLLHNSSPLPSPQWKVFDHFKPKFIENRRKKLENYMKQMFAMKFNQAQRQIVRQFIEEGQMMEADKWHQMRENQIKGKDKEETQGSSAVEPSVGSPVNIPTNRINDQNVPDSILTLPTSSPSLLP
jgi:hypothetical protein